MPTYTPPSTWASGTVVRSTFLDVQVKGNMEYMGTTHHHATGTAGEGAGYLGPVTYFDNLGAAVPSAPTNSTIARVFATATSLGWRASNSSTYYFGDTLHEHSIGTVTYATNDNTFAGGEGAASGTALVGPAIYTQQRVFGSIGTNATISTAITVGGSGSRAVSLVGGHTVRKSSGDGLGNFIILLRNGVSLGSVSWNLRGGGTGSTFAYMSMKTHGTVLLNEASGSVTYGVISKGSAGNSNHDIFGKAISVLEIKQS